MAQVRKRRPSRAFLITCALCVIVMVVVVAACVTSGTGTVVERHGAATEMTTTLETVDPATAVAETKQVPVVTVHVDGAVSMPGVYDLVGDVVRVRDAVAAAGGLSDAADTTSVNLAATVSDGSKVHVPLVGEVATPVTSTTGTNAVAGTSPGGTVDINVADEAALATLPGVGPATSAAIVKDREQNGPFATPEDLMRVSGIGEKKFERLKDSIRV
ncbi:MAG: helix-hairpin-helix domain-containing protein [Atopobiaceae bacterium]|nr:helix-hairpin-helix domain-containing protein [Atopobiaceae bacterium]MCI2173266.1 helix-hairpin-helix domain-containing protein [Atopobiaceae bacterium]MCI2207261.1 helix-hairpin-helix domain-containing protein [Atopobiaceae bacterium]